MYNQKLFQMSADEAVTPILDAVARKKARVLLVQATFVDRLVRFDPERYPARVVAWRRRTFGAA